MLSGYVGIALYDQMALRINGLCIDRRNENRLCILRSKQANNPIAEPHQGYPFQVTNFDSAHLTLIFC